MSIIGRTLAAFALAALVPGVSVQAQPSAAKPSAAEPSAAEPSAAEPYHPAVTALGSGETPASIARFYARDPKPFDLEEAYLEWPVPTAEARYASIDGKRMRQTVVDLTAIALREKARGQYWGRISGTEADMETRRYVAAKFHELGLSEIRVQELELPPQWWPSSWSVTLDQGTRSVALQATFPLGRSPGTAAAGLTAPVVWVGLGTAADFMGRNLHGKIALIYSAPQPNVHGQTAVFEHAAIRAQQAGAAAVLIALDIPGNVSSQMARTGDIEIPGLTIGRADALLLRQAIEAGSAPRVTIKLAVAMVPDRTAANIWGVLPGTGDENVLITAHTDSYFQGAVDNASGVATLLELARYFSRLPQSQRRRSITFIATGGHHEGSPGTHYLHDRMQPFLAKTALLINSEHTAVNDFFIWGDPPEVRRSTQTTGQTMFSLKGSERMQTVALAAFKTFGVGTLEEPEARVNGDVASLFQDVPTVQLIDLPLQYHTDADTVELIPWPGLANITRAYAKLISDLDGVPLGEIRSPREATAPAAH